MASNRTWPLHLLEESLRSKHRQMQFGDIPGFSKESQADKTGRIVQRFLGSRHRIRVVYHGIFIGTYCLFW